MKQQKGFTLIELIMVIVILGILAATALPKFVDIKSDAEIAAMNGVASAVSSAFVVNYAGRMANATKGFAVTGSYTITDLDSLVGSLMAGGMPSGYSVAGPTVSCTAAGEGFTISISNSALTASPSAAATMICTG